MRFKALKISLLNKCQMLLLLLVLTGNGLTLEPLESFNWGTIIEKQPPNNNVQGQQILHFKTTNKPYTLDPQAETFVKNNFKHAQELHSDAATLRFASDHIKIKGAYIELGVCTGRTINLLAALNPNTTI